MTTGASSSKYVGQVIVGVSIMIIMGWIAWISASVWVMARKADSFVTAEDTRAIVKDAVHYPWLADRDFVMSALTDGKSEIKALRESVESIRTEQIEQKTLYRLQREDLQEIKSILKGNGS